MVAKVSKYKLNLFFILAVSLFVSLATFSDSYALEVGGVEIPSTATYTQTGSITYACVSGYMTEQYHRYGGNGIYGTMSGSFDCSSYPNATQVLIESINLNQGIADYSSDYIHLVFVSDQDWIDYCGTSTTGYCSPYTSVSFSRYAGSTTKMYLYDGLTCEEDVCEVTSDSYFSIPVVDNDVYYTFLQFPAGLNYQRYYFQNDYAAQTYLYAYGVNDSVSFGYYFWGDDTDVQPDISNDVPLSPIWSDPDYTGGNDVATDLQFSFNIINPFTSIIPYFSDNATFCPQVLHTWLHLSNSCIQSPWSSTIRVPITITANILLAVYLFGFVISWLKYGEVSIRPIPALGSQPDTPASHGIHGNKGGFAR